MENLTGDRGSDPNILNLRSKKVPHEDHIVFAQNIRIISKRCHPEEVSL